MAKRKITARGLLADLKTDMTDFDFMDKYKLSAQGLQSVFNKLVKAGLITQAELDSRVSMSDRTVDLGFVCPSCGYLRNEEFDECPRCGFATPTYIKREREKERRKKEPPAPPKKAAAPVRRETSAPTIALPAERPEPPAPAPEPPAPAPEPPAPAPEPPAPAPEPPAPAPEPRAPVEETPATAEGLTETVKRSRLLVVAALAAYAVAVVALCIILLVMPAGGTITVTQTLVAILVLQVPIMVIILASFMNLKILTESFKLTGGVSGPLSRRRSA